MKAFPDGESLEGRSETVKAAVNELTDYLIGRNPNDIEDIWQTLYRGGFYRGGPILMSAISGIEQALWDTKGKYFNIPVYQMLGGKARQKIKVYSWVGGDRPVDVVAAALGKQKEGFLAVTMNASEEMNYIDSFSKVEAVVERVASIREAVGKDVGIGVDFHGRIHKTMAKVIVKELEPYRCSLKNQCSRKTMKHLVRLLAYYVSDCDGRKNVYALGL